MASQNVDPSTVNSNVRKQKQKRDVLSDGLHSVTQRSVSIVVVYIFKKYTSDIVSDILIASVGSIGAYGMPL